jgi:hypothetical protein
VTPPEPHQTQRYNTRLNSQGEILYTPEPEIFYRRRNQRVRAREVNQHLHFESLSDIRNLFVNPVHQNMASWLTDCYKPFIFTNIAGYPHDLPDSLKYIPPFNGDRSIGAKEYWEKFLSGCQIYSHYSIRCFFKCFSLAMSGDATKWLESLPDASIDSLKN